VPSPLPYNEQLPLDSPSLLAWNPAVPTIAQTREAAINSIQQNFAALNAGSAPLPYLPLSGGASMTGLFNLSGNATTALQPVTYQQLQAYLAANNGVVTFNTRAGAVTLTSADVAAALGYTAANAAGQVFAGNVSANALTAKLHITTPYVVAPAAGASLALDMNLGSSWLINPQGALTIGSIAIYNGSVMRLFIYPTTNPITWPTSVVWPMTGTTAPNLAAGPLKGAVITLMADASFTGWNVASHSVY